MVRAVRMHAPGAPSVLVVDDVDVPPPAAGEVRVKHTAIGVNFIDINYRTGAYPLALPATLGLEGVGVVVDVGPNVTHLCAGDRVAYYWKTPGAYCDERNVPAARVVLVPNDLSSAAIADTALAAVFMKGLTAEYLVRRTFRVDGHHTIVVYAAAGGVGQLLCQWGRALGARVIAIVSSDDKARVALNAGAHHALTTVGGVADLSKRVRDIAGAFPGSAHSASPTGGVDVVYDSVGKDTFEQSLDMLKPRGMLALFGQSSGPVTNFAPHTLSKKGSLYLTRPSLHDYVHDPGEYRSAADALFDMLKKGALTPHLASVMKLADAAKAHEALESRATAGATVLVP